ncbi:MAG: DNA integrity scanning diadenylate cyclase DisA [Acidimicrobiia bacterium]|nr:DNA integrity scanning diadenylate cyclase DisA [Acidimicrobiia bacterium]
MSNAPNPVLRVLQRLAPGTRLREAFERIMQQGNGALVVLGSGPGVEQIATGGFALADAAFTVAKLAELAKMDGAIVLDDTGDRILRANVHLIPDPSTKTDETGSRHRTAERTAKQTGKPVISVSEDRAVATVFFGNEKHELEPPTVVTAKVNQSLNTLDRFRGRLDAAEERLTRLEVADLTTYHNVVTVLQRAELVRRIGSAVERDSIALGGEGELVRLQLADLMQGIDELFTLVVRDYVKRLSKAAVNSTIEAIEEIATDQLHDPAVVGAAAGFDRADGEVAPRGLRLLSQVPRLPDAVQGEVVKHFGDFRKLLAASVDDLDEVSGVGRTRAVHIRRFLDRVIEQAGLWNPLDDHLA